MRRFVFGLSIILSAAFILLFSLSVDAVQETDISATRTAIAITREPILGTPATPSSIDLTATVAFQEYETRQRLIQDAKDMPLEASASAIVFLVRQTNIALTGTPLPTLTPLSSTPTELPCQLTFYKNTNEIAATEINTSIRVPSSTLIGHYEVNNLELAMPQMCSPETHFLGTNVEIRVKINSLENDNLVIATLEELLLSLQDLHLTGDGQSLRLLIEFYVYEDSCKYRIIDTGFTNARLAYQEGLRGEKLIEALGGIMDTKQELFGVCP
ncbi:MAG: hypothetical protein H0X30_01130 [Anaerolineae bacterium]|nr:hypothetical protein [Anaerolineae bacterium]